jgi:hypothetical protein
MKKFTEENGFFNLEDCQYQNKRTSIIPYQDLMDCSKYGQCWYLDNSYRTEKAILTDQRPNTPSIMAQKGYKLRTKAKPLGEVPHPEKEGLLLYAQKQ